MYAQCMNSACTVHNSKFCLLKSNNYGLKKKKKKKKRRQNALQKTQTPNPNSPKIYNGDQSTSHEKYTNKTEDGKAYKKQSNKSQVSIARN